MRKKNSVANEKVNAYSISFFKIPQNSVNWPFFYKDYVQGLSYFHRKFGHFTKNLSNDTEKHVIQRDS
jgi:hypothetical protein